MRRFLYALILSLLCISLYAAPVFAESSNSGVTFDLADAERLGVDLPEGMVAEVTTADGMINIVIDDEATDWDKVLYAGGNFPYVRIAPTVERPAEFIESHVSFNGSIDDDEWIIESIEHDIANDEGFINKENGNNHRQWANGYFVGEIVADKALLIPWNDGEPDTPFETWGGAAICWIDYDDPDYRYYEKVHICVTHKSMDTFHVPVRFISAETLAPTLDAQQPDNVEISVENGKVTFKVLHRTIEESRIQVAMKVPEGAVVGKCADTFWSDDLYIEDGIAYITDFGPDPTGITRVDERLFTIIWLDGDGNQLDCGFFWTYVLPVESDPWACYVENWNPVDPSRVEIVNNAENCGVEVTYNQSNGIAHIGYDNTVNVTGEPGDVGIYIRPPEGAACFRYNRSGSNVLIGKDDWIAEDQHFIVTSCDIETPDNSGRLCIRDRNPFREYQAGDVTVYIQSDEVWEYGGSVNLVYWYSSEEAANNDPENPMLIEYLCETNETLCQEKRVPLVSEESLITSPVTEVTAVGDYPWNLVVRRYPQKGSNAFHWELHMENETGAYQPLTENMVFYVPYPNGHNNHTEYTYELRHYDDEHSSFTLVDARRTEFGLRFEVSSLSPFVMSWNDGTGEGGDTGEGGEGVEITSIFVLPAEVKCIDIEAFAGMNMEQVVLPDGIVEIGERAFADCGSLLVINLPDSLEFIADDAFSGCDNLTAIVSKGSKAHIWCVGNGINIELK